ncbi:MAG: ATP-binding cassette domain-containing protein [Lachnospiraceae bacterium]
MSARRQRNREEYDTAPPGTDQEALSRQTLSKRKGTGNLPGERTLWKTSRYPPTEPAEPVCQGYGRKRPAGDVGDTGRLRDVIEKTEIGHLLGSHPYDLSGGEQQRAALAKVLLLDPEIIPFG